MMTLFGSFRAPQVPYVDIFRDHEDPHRFYLIPSVPRIATDAKSGQPLFNFTLFSRNIEIAYASAKPGEPVESQLGALNMTTTLSVGADDFAKIRDHIVTVLKDEVARPSSYNALFKLRTTRIEPTLGYPNQWTNGTVRLDMLQGMGTTFLRSSSQDGHPTLTGENTAAVWATFGSEGAQLLWGLLQKPDRNPTANSGNELPLQANIYYELNGYARAPAIKVHIYGDCSTIYKEIRERTTVYERSGNSSWTYPQVSKLVKDLTDSHTLTVEWEDYGIPDSDPKADEIRTQLEQMITSVVMNQIVELFFKPYEVKGVKDDDLGETFTYAFGGKKGSKLWLNEYDESYHQKIDFKLDYTTNVPFKVYPQTSLIAELTDEQLKEAVKVVDVGSPEVRVMQVQLLTNADFQNDKIANISVSLSYRQFDTLVNDYVEASESFIFRTGQETFTFRTRLARDASGKLLDLYDAEARINYIGTSQSPPPIQLKNISDRALTFSYDRLGYVKVEVQAGDIDWTQISDVYVELDYTGSADPEAHGSVHLTDKNTVGRWTCSKRGSTSNRYTYATRYVFKDGHESRKSGSGDSGTLVIHDDLIGRLRRTFDVALDSSTVENVLLKVRYSDPRASGAEEVRHLYTATGSWEYVHVLSEGAPQTLDYAYDVVYKDGEIRSCDFATLRPGDSLPTIRARRYRFSIAVDGGGLDWTKWRMAAVTLVYQDLANGYEVRPSVLRINKDNSFVSVDVLAFAPDARGYSYHVKMVPQSGADVQDIPAGDAMQPATTSLLILQTLVKP